MVVPAIFLYYLVNPIRKVENNLVKSNVMMKLLKLDITRLKNDMFAKAINNGNVIVSICSIIS